MRGFSVILLILVGVAFTTGPAGLLTKITTQSFNFWLVVLLIYYFIATFLPIDKVIGKPLSVLWFLLDLYGCWCWDHALCEGIYHS